MLFYCCQLQITIILLDKLNMIPAKPLDRAISNIKYRLGKYYVRMGLTPLPPQSKSMQTFFQPLSLGTLTQLMNGPLPHDGILCVLNFGKLYHFINYSCRVFLVLLLYFLVFGLFLDDWYLCAGDVCLLVFCIPCVQICHQHNDTNII